MPTKIDDLDDIDFIELYKWLWHRHANTAMPIMSFKNSVETYLLNHECLSKEKDADVKVVKVLMGMDLLSEHKNSKLGRLREYYLIFNKILEEDIET